MMSCSCVYADLLVGFVRSEPGLEVGAVAPFAVPHPYRRLQLSRTMGAGAVTPAAIDCALGGLLLPEESCAMGPPGATIPSLSPHTALTARLAASAGASTTLDPLPIPADLLAERFVSAIPSRAEPHRTRPVDYPTRIHASLSPEYLPLPSPTQGEQLVRDGQTLLAALLCQTCKQLRDVLAGPVGRAKVEQAKRDAAQRAVFLDASRCRSRCP